jgi:hypothetical protein
VVGYTWLQEACSGAISFRVEALDTPISKRFSNDCWSVPNKALILAFLSCTESCCARIFWSEFRRFRSCRSGIPRAFRVGYLQASSYLVATHTLETVVCRGHSRPCYLGYAQSHPCSHALMRIANVIKS